VLQQLAAVRRRQQLLASGPVAAIGLGAAQANSRWQLAADWMCRQAGARLAAMATTGLSTVLPQLAGGQQGAAESSWQRQAGGPAGKGWSQCCSTRSTAADSARQGAQLGCGCRAGAQLAAVATSGLDAVLRQHGEADGSCWQAPGET
jgi:hypothetical protein